MRVEAKAKQTVQPKRKKEKKVQLLVLYNSDTTIMLPSYTDDRFEWVVTVSVLITVTINTVVRKCMRVKW